MSDIFKEVDEELRQERLYNLWKKWGPWVIGLAVAVVFAVGGYQLWTYLDRQDSQADSAALVEAAAPIEDGNFEEAIKRLSALRPDLDGDMRAIVRLREAEARLETEDETGAVAVLNAIAADSGASRRYRDLAVLYAAALELDSASFDELSARLTPLTEPEDTWRFSARELLGFAAIKADRPEAARTHFEAITAAAEAPAGFRRRARQMIEFIGPGESGDPAQSGTPAATNGGAASEDETDSTSGEEAM